MTTKLFWLYPIDGSEWHSPEEVLARLTQVFDNVSVDRDKARILGQQFISSYRLLLDANLGVETSTPIDKVERQWSHALILQVSDVSQDTAPFQVFVRTEDKLELQFPPKMPFHRKRRSAEKVSKALGYTIEHFNPDY